MVIEAVEQQAELLLADAKDRWRSGEDVDAPTFLSEHPEITARRSLVLDVAYEDFCQHVDATDDKAVEAFLNRFPSFRNSLRKQIEVHQYLATHEDMLALAANADWPQPGDTIFDFKVLEELGRGTFARVYLCTQSGLGDRQVVVKVGHEGAYEADMLGKFSHRNIMPVHSVHRDELSGMSALCMPYRGRSTLCDVLDVAFAQGSCPKKARPILAAASRWTRSNEADPEDRPWQARLQRMNYVDAILELGVRLAEGLQHAHDQGILHGDLKPSNVLVTPAGTALVLDFNLAWQEQTRTAAPGGTLPYMAPEQIQSTIIELDGNPPRVDARADIFSLGAMLYELMCGRLPFPPAGGSLGVRATALQLLEAHHRGPRPLNRMNRQVGNDVATCIARCLSAEPAQRPASMAELAADLRRCLIPSRRVGRWLQVHQRWATGTAVLLVAAAIAIAAYFVGRDPYPMRQFQAGVHAFHQADWAAAVTSFDRAIDAKPDFAEAYFMRGRSRLRQENYVIANRDFETANRLQPSGRYAAGHAMCLIRLQYYKRAAMLYQEALDDRYTDVGVYNNLAYCKMLRGDLHDARQLLDEGIAQDPAPYQLFLNRALLEQTQAQQRQDELPESACDDIDRAIERSPPNGELHYIAAHLHALRSRHDPLHSAPALDHLANACRRGVRASKQSILQDPNFASLREHPRFIALVDGKVASAPDHFPDRILDPLPKIR